MALTEPEIEMAEYTHYTMENDRFDDGLNIYGWGTYGRSSVLAGQARKQFIGCCESQEEAEAKYPGISWGNKWIDPQNSVNHLPDGPDYW
jgi:hypothetical protein